MHVAAIFATTGMVSVVEVVDDWRAIRAELTGDLWGLLRDGHPVTRLLDAVVVVIFLYAAKSTVAHW
jgi:hypothetical protein